MLTLNLSPSYIARLYHSHSHRQCDDDCVYVTLRIQVPSFYQLRGGQGVPVRVVYKGLSQRQLCPIVPLETCVCLCM